MKKPLFLQVVGNKLDMKRSYTLPLMIFLAIVCIGLYANTYNNGYCLDDVMVITENTNTQKGFSGIQEHLTKDYLYGYIHTPSESALSPWRPIPLISYSLEVGMWGSNHPSTSHLINILLYTITTILLFFFLSKHVLKDQWLAFFTALLFAIHPIHTEVVANIKSRDEIFSLLFIICSLHLLFNYVISSKKRTLLLSLVFFFLALLSKESAITFLFGVPIFLYFFEAISWKKIKTLTGWFFLTTVIYSIIRFSILPINFAPVDNTGSLIIINYPFLYAMGYEAFFTKILILLKYLILLFVPYPLRYDYSYNQIPYVDGTNPMVWLSFLIYGLMTFFAIKSFKKKNIFSFCILLFFITFSLATNLFIELAVTIGERLLFVPSVFFCIAIIYAGNKLLLYLKEKWGFNKKIAVVILIVPICFFCSWEVISRNKDWKDMDTLNMADYPKIKNSIRANDGIANYYLIKAEQSGLSVSSRDSLLHLAIKGYSKSLELFPEFDKALINIGVCYDRLGKITKAEEYWAKLKEVSPSHPKLIEYERYLSNYYMNKGINTNQQKNYDSSLYYFGKATKYATANDTISAQVWYHAAGMYYAIGKYQLAHDALYKVLQIEPNNKTAQMGYQSCEAILKKP